MYNIEGGLWIRKHSYNVTGLNILEFGNQHIWEHAKSFLSTNSDVAKDWYMGRGAKEYVSIDTNGQDGALSLDLTKPLPQELQNRFDVVTNIGTIEHFDIDSKSQWQGFYNAVDLCKIGGIILHQLVPENMWLDHCKIWYKDGLGEVFAKYFGCDLLEENRLQLFRLNPNVEYICIALKKIRDVAFDPEPPKEFIKRIVL